MARKKRPPLLLPAPKRSARLYARIAERDIALFRFLLEAWDNLGYMSVVDCNAAVLKVVFSPHQEREMRECLESMRRTVDFTVIERPGSAEAARARTVEHFQSENAPREEVCR